MMSAPMSAPMESWLPDSADDIQACWIGRSSTGIQAGFLRIDRVRESIFEWIIWRFPASSMILSKISPEIEPKQNNVLPREIELYWMRQHANRRGCPGPPEVGVYTRNDASMKVSYDVLSIPLIPIIHQNRGLFHILFSESPRSFDHGLSWPFQCSWVCLPFISIPTCFSWDFWSWINSDHGSP